MDITLSIHQIACLLLFGGSFLLIIGFLFGYARGELKALYMPREKLAKITLEEGSKA